MKRVDAWALRMDAFEYDVEHIKGESNTADPSSRLVKGVGVKNFDDNPTPGEIMSCSIEIPNDISFADGIVTIEEIVWHAQRDPVMKEVMKALDTNDWPRALGKFKTVRHELREVEGVLTRMGEIVVPEALRPKILTTAHMGHPGENAMKSAMRGEDWWPGMLAQTERWVRDCTPCTLMSRRKPPMPMQRSRLPAAVWETVAMDFCGPYQHYGGMSVLLLVDTYSRYVIARPVRSTDIDSFKGVLVDVMDTFGKARVWHTDNCPPFNGHGYGEFARSVGTEVTFSTPLDAQQNGAAESYMKSVKKAMAMPTVEQVNWKVSLGQTIAVHNSARCEATGAVPEELMFGRKIRRNLPMISTKASNPTHDEVRERDWAVKMKHKAIADKKTRQRKPNQRYVAMLREVVENAEEN